MSEKKQKNNNVDIFSMLTKAQEDFNRTPYKGETQPQFSSTPRAPDVTSQSVMDFFAKAISKTTKTPNVVNPVESENLLQRLMSNPEHSVEHIEKQQRSITPQEQVLMRKKSISLSDRRSVPINLTNVDKKPENGFNFIGSPQQQNITGSSPLSTFFMQQTPGGAVEDREQSGASPLAHLLETPQKPTLLPPIMFTSTSPKEKGDTSINQGNITQNKLKDFEPLTKNQMIQAFSYLLKNDPDFVTKLHEAYVKSITEMVHSNCNNSLL